MCSLSVGMEFYQHGTGRPHCDQEVALCVRCAAGDDDDDDGSGSSMRKWSPAVSHPAFVASASCADHATPDGVYA